MPVHPSSVISTTINTLNPSLYVALTDKENHSYTTFNPNTGTPIITYSPKYTTLSDNILSYFNMNRDLEIADLFAIAYGYRTMYVIFNTNFSVNASLKATDVYSMNGGITNIITQPVDYFSDYDGAAFTNLDASNTDSANASNVETNNINSLKGSMTSTVKLFTNILLLEDRPQNAPPTKQEMGQWFLGSGVNDLGYKAIINYLNINMFVPTYVV